MVVCVQANQPSAAAQPSSSATEARAIQRRSTRSAVQPVTSVSRNKGHELDQADDPEPERGLLEPHRMAGDVVDLPADDDHHRHLPIVQVSRASQK